MNFINKQDVALFQVGKQRRQVTGAFQRRAGGDSKIHAQLVGDDRRQRGFSQAGRAIQQHVIQRFAAQASGIDKYRQIFLHLFLTDIIVHGTRAQRIIAFVLRKIFC